MISVCISSMVDLDFNGKSGQTKDGKILYLLLIDSARSINLYSYKYAFNSINIKIICKDWLARNQDNLLKCSDMSACVVDCCFNELAL